MAVEEGSMPGVSVGVEVLDAAADVRVFVGVGSREEDATRAGRKLFNIATT